MESIKTLKMLHYKLKLTLLMNQENMNARWAEERLQSLGKKIDELIHQWKNSDGKVKKEFEARINELKKNRDKLKEEFEGFSEKNKPRFQEAAERLEQAGREIKKAFDALIK